MLCLSVRYMNKFVQLKKISTLYIVVDFNKKLTFCLCVFLSVYSPNVEEDGKDVTNPNWIGDHRQSANLFEGDISGFKSTRELRNAIISVSISVGQMLSFLTSLHPRSVCLHRTFYSFYYVTHIG